MLKTLMATAAIMLLLSGCGGTRDAATIIADANEAMGSASLTAITYSGTAADVNFLQTPDIDGPWPSRPITNYTRSIDLNQPAVRSTGETSNVGIFGGDPVPGVYNQNIGASATQWGQVMEFYLTPWGFLKGAAANNATMSQETVDGAAYTALSWMTPQMAPSGIPYKVTGYLDGDDMVARVDTWLEHPTLGDMHVEVDYSGYQDFGGVKVPTNIVQKRGGWPFFETTVASATANPGNIAEILAAPPPQVAGKGGPPQGKDKGKGKGADKGKGKAGPPQLASEQIAPGVHRITGGYVSLAIEFEDHIMLLEGGQSEARGLDVIAEAKRLIPNKPIRYVMNSHPHSDHTAGLAPFVAEGATIITHENNVKYLTDALSAPRTLVGDTLAKNPKPVTVEGVGASKTYQDGMRTVEFRHVENLDHSHGMLIAYLPKEKIVFQADFTLPQPGQQANPFVVTLAQNVASWNLDFDRFVPVHAPNPDVPWRKADLMRAAGL